MLQDLLRWVSVRFVSVLSFQLLKECRKCDHWVCVGWCYHELVVCCVVNGPVSVCLVYWLISCGWHLSGWSNPPAAHSAQVPQGKLSGMTNLECTFPIIISYNSWSSLMAGMQKQANSFIKILSQRSQSFWWRWNGETCYCISLSHALCFAERFNFLVVLSEALDGSCHESSLADHCPSLWCPVCLRLP